MLVSYTLYEPCNAGFATFQMGKWGNKVKTQ